MLRLTIANRTETGGLRTVEYDLKAKTNGNVIVTANGETMLEIHSSDGEITRPVLSESVPIKVNNTGQVSVYGEDS